MDPCYGKCNNYKYKFLLLQTTRRHFYPDVDQFILYKHHLIGEGLSPPSLKDYKVFVQSTGPGSRHLSKGSTVLYEVNCVLVHL